MGITRPCTKHNYLVKSADDLPRILHEAFMWRPPDAPAPLWSIFRRTFSSPGEIYAPRAVQHKTYKPQLKGDIEAIYTAVEYLEGQKPVFYTGGGVINSGPQASQLLREFVKLTGFPITSTLMGLGAFPLPTRNGSACWACTALMRQIWQCMTAMS